jgi:penicillin amidase
MSFLFRLSVNSLTNNSSKYRSTIVGVLLLSGIFMRAAGLPIAHGNLDQEAEVQEKQENTEQLNLAGLNGPVEVVLDAYSIPHVFAESWVDAARVLGYLHARDRLWQMDLMRRQASGTLAEILGPDVLESDKLMRQLGVRISCERLWQSEDIPLQMRREIEAYTEGVNQRMASLAADQLPLPFQALEYSPEKWGPVDSLVFSKYMGWDQGGTFDDLWFGGIVEKMGLAAWDELWPMDRPYEQSTVTTQSERADFLGSGDKKKLSQLPVAPIWQTRNAEQLEDLGGGLLALYRRLNQVGWLGRGSSFGSNNWAVSGEKTRSGKPMVCSDPHLGFTIPSIWYAAHLSVQGENVVGVSFPGAPTIVIGHNDSIAWGLTNMQADAVDYFIETIDPQNPERYLHRGQWISVDRRRESIPVRGSEPFELIIDHTVHGPIISREDAVISLCWTGLGPTSDAVAFWEISRAKNLSQFLSGLDKLQVPALNVVYGDIEGNIAIHCCGRLPVRARGHGRIPLDGASGDSDWSGWIDRDKLPLLINPPEQFVASANGRPHPLGYPHYLGWMWDPSYRTRRIRELLSSTPDLSMDSMREIQFDHFDYAASRFLPVMLDALTEPFESAQKDEAVLASLEIIRGWDYVASRESVGTAIWLRWFEKYRESVWQDEWIHFGIEPEEGSWGFTGDNRREPMLEVLEFLTLEVPQSRWFDDRSTPIVETRDQLLRSSFLEAIASLQSEFGDDVNAWLWGNINQLSIDSMTGDPRISVTGIPVVGSMFTLNPGGNVGPVGGGASWRMIVDFGRLDQSVGVYPGGQSEDPMSQHYSDQIPLWAAGQYLPLNMQASAQDLPAAAQRKRLLFK